MSRLRAPLSRVLFLILVSLLIVATGNARPKQKTSATSGSCTTRTKLYCEIYGKGQPILFIHGLGGSSYSWRFMVPEFKLKYQVILIDLLGAGKSPKPKGKVYSILEQGKLVHDFIVEKNLQNLVLVGNSYGGAVSLLVAMQLVAEPPVRLSRLVLIDSAGYPDHLPDYLKILRTPMLGWLAVYLIPPSLQIYIVLRKSYYDPDLITTEQISKYAKPIKQRGGRHALLQLARQAIPDDICDYIAKYPTIKVPTLILWGDDDRVLPEVIGCRLQKAIHGSTMEIINEAGHIPQEEQPDQVICRINKFLGAPTACAVSRPPKCDDLGNPCPQ